MHTKNLALVGLGVVALLVSSSMALYYRSRALHFQSEWAAVLAQLSRQPSERDEPSSTPQEKGDAPATLQLRTESANQGKSLNLRSDREAGQAESAESIQPDSETTPEDGSLRPLTANPRAHEEAKQHRLTEQLQRQQAQQQVQNSWDQSTNYFLNRKTSGMNQEQLAEYNGMLALLNETRALKQVSQGGMRPDERQAVTSAIQSNTVALTSMLERERDREYRDLARAMGQGEADAAAFAGYINQITSNTSIRTIFPEPANSRGGSMGGFISRGSRSTRTR